MEAPSTLSDIAQRALASMREAGFHEAQVSATATRLHELNVNHNEPSLLRDTESHRLFLLGIVDGRMASTEVTDLRPQAVRDRAAALFADAAAAPQDDANAVSRGQQAHIVKGPQQADLDTLATKMRELLAFRASQTPRMMVDEANASHRLVRSHIVTSGGSELDLSVGTYLMTVFGTAREGSRSSSFNYTGGAADDLASAPAVAHFGIEQMLRETERQIRTEPAGGKFVGEVVLTPNAVESLLGWLLGQLADTQLIAGSSLYRQRVGSAIGSKLLNVRSRFDGPGCVPVSPDAHLAAPVEVVRDGTLLTLTPTLYGSRKTGCPHVPVAADGWEIGAGAESVSTLLRGVQRGALVGRLSMGMPAANGNFSGVIKNSFSVRDGETGPALGETMISGNMAQMLRDITGISSERIDVGGWILPWVRIANLHFS